MPRSPRLSHALRATAALALFALLTCSPRAARAERLLELCDVAGVRDNQIFGYGVVTGLNGTGDDVSVPFAAQSLRAMLRRLGVQVEPRQLRLRNVAAVMVTATLPPFARSGLRLDVTVSSIGNARSLRGGVLLQSPLRAADRRVYAVAQGPLIVGGFSAQGSSGSSVSENVTTTARLPSGALVERELVPSFVTAGMLSLSLRTASFVTAQRVAEAVERELGAGSARALDSGSVLVTPPKDAIADPVKLLARLSALEVEPEQVARVVINERTGTVVAGGDVKLAPVAIAQGGLTLSIGETPAVSQPGPLAVGGTTAVVPDSRVEVDERVPPLSYVKGAATLADVAAALSALGASPRELASILQALRTAGALRAELVVQ